MCINSSVFNRNRFLVLMVKRQVKRQMFAHFINVEVKNKSQLDKKIDVNSEAKSNLEGNRTSAFRLNS